MESREKIRRLCENIERSLKGKPEGIRMALVALLARGHLLIEDVPGVGKSTLAESLARSVHCAFKRIQFTSDLLPSDILGVPIFNPKENTFEFRPGPIFTQILLADEINRTTPKTQSALLEAMNDGRVTVENETYPLPKPFMVIATQNPSDHHGVYPLPESQLDRFMIRIRLGYPAAADEKAILLQSAVFPGAGPVVSAEEVLKLQEEVEGVKVDESLVDYILAVAQATRLSPSLSIGVSTRGALFLQRASRALAFVEGRDYCLPDDIKKLAPLVFSHRLVLKSRQNGSPAREADSIISEILETVPVPI
ncbi:MAG TPA: MoxR family ATPase [Candidatus Manganitrophaceae bacterium]|nr:MoxR family ATPase [Candidatus Manganitrophaceae bacterium]